MSDEGNFDLYAHIVNKTVDYHTAIFTTFNFDIEYFEKNVLNLLINADTRKIVVYVDYMQFQNSIQNYEPRHLGAKYILRLVDLSGASFHPKLVLLLSNQEIRLIAGSGNVTYTGHKINNEIFNFIDYKYGEKENAKAVKLALEFIKTIEEQFVIKDRFSVVKDMLKSIPTIDESDSKDDRMIIHNLNRSIFEQLKEIIDDNITAIKIAVPYYDNELLALSNVMNTFKIMPIIYLQNLKCLFLKNIMILIKSLNLKTLMWFQKSMEQKNFIMGKCFYLKGCVKIISFMEVLIVRVQHYLKLKITEEMLN